MMEGDAELKKYADMTVSTFFLTHHELLFNEFRCVLLEKCNLTLDSTEQQVNVYFEETYKRVTWDHLLDAWLNKVMLIDERLIHPVVIIKLRNEFESQGERHKMIMKKSLIAPDTFKNACAF